MGSCWLAFVPKRSSRAVAAEMRLNAVYSDPAFFPPDSTQDRESLERLLPLWFVRVMQASLPANTSQRLSTDISTLVSVVLALTVQSDRNQIFVGKIQTLKEGQQEELMKIIEGITSSLVRTGGKSSVGGAGFVTLSLYQVGLTPGKVSSSCAKTLGVPLPRMRCCGSD
jgi:hypothetical protein